MTDQETVDKPSENSVSKQKPKMFSHYAVCPGCGGLVSTIDTLLKGGEASLKSLLNSEEFLIHCDKCDHHFTVEAHFYWTVRD